MGLGGRIERIEEQQGPELCAERPCATITHTELLLLPGGRTERVGNASPPLCANCPHREAKGQAVRRVEVVLDYRGRHAQQEATSPARVAPALQHAAAPNTEPEQAQLPGKQQAEGEADPVMRLARRMQEQEDAEAAKHEGRNRNRGTPLFNPSDFGV